MPGKPPRANAEGGQASAELVAAAGIVVVLLLVVVQAAIVGYALWSAASGARAGARAAHVGGDVEAAARSALPTWLERHASVETGGPVEVTVDAPALVPGVPRIAVSAATALASEPAGG